MTAPWPGRTWAFSAGSLFVRESGAREGELAVFVHGLGGSATNWTDLMALLGARVRGLAPDLPGFGYSDPAPDGNYTLAAHARAVIALIEACGSGPAHLFGNSLGGAVATRLAALRPDLVRTLTLVSPALPAIRPLSATDARMLLVALPGLGRRLAGRMGTGPAEDRARALLELCYFDPTRVSPERRAEAVAEIRRRDGLGHGDAAFVGSLRGLLASSLAAGAGSLWRQVRAVRGPVLLIWGRHDRLVPVSVASRAASAFRGSHLVIFDDAGHVAQMEKPEETAEVISAFLDEARGGNAG
ncbi:MAG: alpha/beta fold hydrolase [Mycobacteriales bacterium]